MAGSSRGTKKDLTISLREDRAVMNSGDFISPSGLGTFA